MWLLDMIARHDPDRVASAISNGLLVLLAISFIFLLQDRLRSPQGNKAMPAQVEAPCPPAAEEEFNQSKMPLT
jgi:hypothetical protein